jgi:ribosomal protein S18 acetylase RimI-like enzyme
MSVLAVGYHKRYKMEADLDGLPRPVWPSGFAVRPWSSDVLHAHGEVLAGCFAGEVDAQIFPSLGSVEGAINLIQEIARRATFIPEATWLVVGPEGPCGTVQTMHDRPGLGAIQNIGILPAWRGRGLGRALLLRALQGMCDVGLSRAMLEVTAANATAITLYASLGFRRSRVVYKAVPGLPLGDGGDGGGGFP